jgi:hypothetical protein
MCIRDSQWGGDGVVSHPIKKIACPQGHPVPDFVYHPGEIFDPDILVETQPIGHDDVFDPMDYVQCEDCEELFLEEDFEDHECLA